MAYKKEEGQPNLERRPAGGGGSEFPRTYGHMKRLPRSRARLGENAWAAGPS